jgi:hypothetical protein
MTCPQRHKVTYPLTRGYRIAYWVFVALMAVFIIESALKGHIAMPGLIGILMIIGLIRDASVRKRVASLRPALIPRPSRPAVKKPA